MTLLAIDCATEACSVALFDSGRLIAGEHRVLMRGHAEALVPMIAALPDRGRAALVAGSQAEALVAARGSGEALALLPDAREVPLLGEAALLHDVHLIYGRAPDARLPGA